MSTTTKTQSSISHITAYTITPTSISLNGERLEYRIGTSDRTIGAFSDAPNGFLVLNQTNGKVFQSFTVASTTISSDINVGDTSVSITSATGFPPSNFNINCEGEIISVISRSGTTLTVNPIKVEHLSGATISYTIWVTFGSVNSFDSVDPTLIPTWFASTTTVEGPGIGYRIGTSDRKLGDETNAPEGFICLNTTNNKVFQVSGGVWIDGGSFPDDLLAAWELA